MILACIAEYDAHTDSVQVAIVVQNDDRTSAASSLKTGTVEFLHNDTTMLSGTFDSLSKVLWYDGEGIPLDRGEFYMFLWNPPIQRHMNVKISVEMINGDEATQTIPVTLGETKDKSVWQNPTLSGRDADEYPIDPAFP